jgi:predicted Zn-dependent peptidase
MLDRKTAPAIHDAIEFDFVLPTIQKEELKNGMPLYWFNGGVQDVVEINWVFPAGLWYETKSAVAHAVTGLMKNGTSTKSAHEINEALEFYGASLRIHPGNDFATLTLHTLTKHLPSLLPIIYEILSDAVFPEEELQLHKQNSIQKLLVSMRKCDFVANQKIDAALFGEEHPYGRFTQQLSIEELKREDLLAFYQKNFSLTNAQIFMAGKVGKKEIDIVNEVFGKQIAHSEKIVPQTFAPITSTEKKQEFINDVNGVQGAIRLGRLFPNRHHEDYAPMVVLNTLFGGYFGSRLMSNIREEKGFTYGIYSSIAPYINSGSLSVHTEVGREVIEPALKEIKHEMNLLCNELADDEELLLVKNYLLGNLLGDIDGPFQIMQRWRMLLLNGLDENHFNRNVRIYKSISTKELQTLAQKYLNPDDYLEVVVV